jgi:hypothetical protein
MRSEEHLGEKQGIHCASDGLTLITLQYEQVLLIRITNHHLRITPDNRNSRTGNQDSSLLHTNVQNLRIVTKTWCYCISHRIIDLVAILHLVAISVSVVVISTVVIQVNGLSSEAPNPGRYGKLFFLERRRYNRDYQCCTISPLALPLDGQCAGVM